MTQKNITKITTSDYKNLLLEIQKEVEQTQRDIIKTVTRRKVEMAWKVGGLVAKHLQKNPDSSYGKQLFKRLESDLKIAEKSLYQMHSFYKSYKKLPVDDARLNWSHYRVLAGVKEKDERKYFENLARESAWDANRLQLEVTKKKTKKLPLEKSTTARKAKKLKPLRGRIFAYKITKLSTKDFFFDLGFEIFAKINDPLANSLRKEKALVDVQKNSTRYVIKKSAAKSKQQLHTYAARLDRIVDGDTLHVILDLGFGMSHRENLRLKGINAPESDTADGKNSTKILQEILKQAPFLVVKTLQTDIYNRYVADVFLGEENKSAQEIASGGVYLNQLLVERGAAELVDHNPKRHDQ